MAYSVGDGLERSEARALGVGTGRRIHPALARGGVVSDSKKPAYQGRSIVLTGESGFMLQSVVRHTWASRGQTPVQYSWDQHDRLSVIAALIVSLQRKSLGLYFQMYSRNTRAKETVRFLRQAHRQVRRKMLVALDRYSVHRKAV